MSGCTRRMGQSVDERGELGTDTWIKAAYD